MNSRALKPSTAPLLAMMPALQVSPPPPCSPSLSTNPIHDHDTHAASLVIGPIRPLLQNQAEAYLIPVYKTVSTLLDGG